MDQLFVLMKSQRRRGPQDGGGDGPPPQQMAGDGNGGLSEDERAELMSQRVQRSIARLPADQRQSAMADFNAERAFWQGLRGLSPEERRQKMQDHFNDPNFQDKMEQRSATRDALSTPQQRDARANRYLQNKARVLAAGH